jgi:hypothetical protein
MNNYISNVLSNLYLLWTATLLWNSLVLLRKFNSDKNLNIICS